MFARLLIVVMSVGVVATANTPAQSPRTEKLLHVQDSRPNRYIVKMQEGAKGPDFSSHANALAASHRGLVHKHFPAFGMFAVEISASRALALSQDPLVEFVEEEGMAAADAVQDVGVGLWGLDRIDQRTGLDFQFTYSSALKTVTIYVMDSGVRPTHGEFMSDNFSRVTLTDFTGGNGLDCRGHGTHVAGTVAGRTTGIAKFTPIQSLRVLDCNGNGFDSDIIEAIHYVTVSGQRPAVVNMSLGGPPSEAEDSAIRQSIASGAVYVVSAGNEGQDAVNKSPARVVEAITVGSSTSSDAKALTSNFGPRVDLFAPGSGITSADFRSDTGYTEKSGTSMAAPHVTGVLALFLAGHPEWTPAAVQQVLVSNATRDAIANPGEGTPNRLLYSGFVNDASTFQTVPTKMAPGGQYTVSVTATNTGTTTWINQFSGNNNNYWLGARNSNWGLQWVPQPFPTEVGPEQAVTFTFPITAPATPGPYAFDWLMLQSGVDWFGKPDVTTVTVGNLAEDASFVSQAVPPMMVPGQPYNVSMRMKNTGSTTWAGHTQDGTPLYGLISESPEANRFWGVSRVGQVGGTSVAPGQEATFNFMVTPPAGASGFSQIPFQWRMHNAGSNGAFGSYSPSQPVELGNWRDDAEFVSMHLPEKVRVGESYWVSATFKNRGRGPWHRDLGVSPLIGAGVYLDADTVWGNRVDESLPRLFVFPGEYVTFNLRYIVQPTTDLVQHVQWTLQHIYQTDGTTAIFAPLGGVGLDLVTRLGNWAEDAEFVSYAIPNAMLPGQSYPVSVTMRNRGTSTWTEAGDYWLGIREGAEPFNTWNHDLPVPTVVSGQEVTFNFVVTAPTSPGSYRLAWQMVDAGPSQPDVTRWFGTHTPVATINVAPDAVPASITVTTPNTRTNWVVGSVQRVAWTHSGLAPNSLMIAELSRDGGRTFPEMIEKDVANNTATTGGFNWSVTEPLTTEARIRVRVMDGHVSDVSDVNFGIGSAAGPVPVAAGDAYTSAFGAVLRLPAPGVLGNDNGQANGIISAALVSGVSQGTLALNPTGAFTYTPSAGFAGTENFTYRAVNAAGAGNVATVVITVAAPGTVQAPTGLYVLSVSGRTVTLRWDASPVGPRPTGFLVEGGLSPGDVVASFASGSRFPVVTFVAPIGSFYIRVRALNDAETSAPSNEVPLFVTQVSAPSAPADLVGLVSGSAVQLAWRNTFGGGEPTGLTLVVSGNAVAAVRLTGLPDTFSFPEVPAGTYTFAVRASNAAGDSAISNPVTLTFPGACSGPPETPTHFLTHNVANRLFADWSPATVGPAPSGYVIHVSGAIAGSVMIPAHTINGVVPSGSYGISVSAMNACGSSVATPMQSISIP